MDSFIWNTATPSSSDIDLLIEKFTIELSNASSVDDDNVNTRRITITPTVEAQDPRPNNDIDNQITELENLIKKLQDELNELSENADKETSDYVPIEQKQYDIHEDLSNQTIILDNESDDPKIHDTESLRSKMKREDIRTDVFEFEQFSHVFPLLIQEVILPLASAVDMNEMEEFTKENSDTKGSKEITTVKQDVIDICDDLPKHTADDNLEELLYELQAEITEKLNSPKALNLEETNKTPDAKFEDAQ